MSFDLPIVLIVFNRPDLARGLVEALRPIAPRRLLVIADGPRTGRDGEDRLCAETRAEIARIDWPCEIERDYADANLGCGRRVASGLDWAFGLVERAIVLEDDIRPAPDFYPYAEELLAHYALEPRVFMVSGFNPAERLARPSASFAFTRFAHVWGWATWARSWNSYARDFPGWRKGFDESDLRGILGDEAAANTYSGAFDLTAAGEIDTWDYQLVYAMWRSGGVSTVPAVNLVSNLGFRADATHTTSSRASRYFETLRTGDLAFPLVHPETVLAEESVHRRLLVANTRAKERGLARAGGRLRARLSPGPRATAAFRRPEAP